MHKDDLSLANRRVASAAILQRPLLRTRELWSCISQEELLIGFSSILTYYYYMSMNMFRLNGRQRNSNKDDFKRSKPWTLERRHLNCPIYIYGYEHEAIR